MPDPSPSPSPDPSQDPFDPVEILNQRFRDAIAAAFPGIDADPLIGPSRQTNLGDFQSNAAMPLAKRVGKPPRDVAKAIIAHADLAGIAEPLTDDAIAGPGFINIRLAPDALARLLGALDTPDLGVLPPEHPETVVVDLCGVNLAKQMHVGHLRSTVIGDAVARVLERLGHRVIRQSHVGDWGLPIAMVTAALDRESRAGRIDPEKLTLEDLDRLYRAAQAECAPDRKGLEAARRWNHGPKAVAELEEQVAAAEEALAAARATLVRLQSQDPETVAVWQKIYDITMDACVRTCARLHADVTDDHAAGESTYRHDLAPLVQDLAERRIAEESDGALVVRVEGIAEPCLVRKRDGGYLYATTDLAAIKRRVHQLGADRVVYCVDSRQSLHFRQVFGGAAAASYATRPGADAPSRLEHAAFGNVLGEDHRPLKTRSGENVRLTDLIDEAVRRAGETVAEKNPDLSPDERAPIAEDVAVAAIKYADLASDRVKDYVFSFDRMLAFEGNTGPYLLYALVRTRSIFRRAAEQGIGIPEVGPVSNRPSGNPPPFHIAEPEEKTLALQLLRYPQTLAAVGEHLEPHRLCAYLYDLAVAFSAFFDRCPVLRAPTEDARDARLRLCRLTARVLEDGLHTLGLPTPERM